MKHISFICKIVYFVCASGFLSPIDLSASVSFSVGGPVSTSVYTEDNHDKNLALFRASLLKSSSAPLLLTDSIVVYNNYANGDSSKFHKVTYQYNQDQLLASVYYYRRNINNSDWESYQKEDFKFNASTHPINFTLYQKRDGRTEWFHQLQREYFYTSGNQLSMVAEYHWNEIASDWEGQWMHEIDHYSSQLQKSKINYIWNAPANSWSPSFKHEFEYHTNGELSRRTSYAFNAENLLWEGQQKSEFEYSDDLLKVQTDFYWDLFNSPASWIASNKREYFYNGKGEQISWQWYRWNRNFSKWEEWWKIEHFEDLTANTNTWVDAQWDGNSEAWISNWRVDTKGKNDQPMQEAAYLWDNETAEWYGMYKVDYVYGDKDQLQEKWEFHWDATYDSWRIKQKQFYFSSLAESEPEEGINSGDFIVYPNPSQQFVYIESSSIIHSLLFYSIDGRLLMQANPNELKTEIPVQHLPAGLYIIKTGTVNGTRFSKIVVK